MPDGAAISGFLLVDKPVGFTSHDTVAVVRRALRERRVGHAGTLDPAASGLLVLAAGRSTRLLTFLVGADKQYEAVIRIGVATDTEDAAGRVVSTPGAGSLSESDVRTAAASFVGQIMQRPSTVSAIKVAGKRAYQRVRDGESLDLPERPVTVHSLDIGSVSESEAAGVAVLDVGMSVHVSSGTYVRALARDLGAALGSAAHLIGLRRTAVGRFRVEEAFDRVPELGSRSGEGADERRVGSSESAGEDLRGRLIGPGVLADTAWDTVTLGSEAESAVRHGRRIPSEDAEPGITALLSRDGALLAMAEPVSGMWRYRVVMAQPHPPEPMQ